MELFSTALSYLTAQSTLNFTWTLLLKHKSNIKGAIFELRSSHLFRVSCTKNLWKQSVRPAISQVFYPLWVFLRILVTFFGPVFCRTSHNLICNKFAMLKNKKLAKILKVGNFSSYVTLISTLFCEWQNFLWQS